MVQVKKNCPKLYENLTTIAENSSANSSHKYEEKGVTREVEVFDIEGIISKDWKMIHSFTKVRRSGIRNGKPFEKVAFYVSNTQKQTAQTMATAIQQHWTIEGYLHWYKDVIMGEDQMELRNRTAVLAITTLNNLIVNLLSTKDLKPNKETFAFYNNKVDRLYDLLFK